MATDNKAVQPSAEQVKFDRDVHAAKTAIQQAIDTLERAQPGHLVKVGYITGNGGINFAVDEKPRPTLSYHVKAGNTVPLAKSAAAAALPPPTK